MSHSLVVKGHGLRRSVHRHGGGGQCQHRAGEVCLLLSPCRKWWPSSLSLPSPSRQRFRLDSSSLRHVNQDKKLNSRLPESELCTPACGGVFEISSHVCKLSIPSFME